MLRVALNFHCARPCMRSFSSQRGLTKHQDTCNIYNEVMETDFYEAAQTEENERKRRRIGSLDEATNVNFDSDMTQDQNLNIPIAQQYTMTQLGNERGKETLAEAPPEKETEELGRGKRKKWRTQRYIDPQPQPAAPLPEPEPATASVQVEGITDTNECRTLPNANGIFREYVTRPSFVPDEWLHSKTDENEADDREPEELDNSQIDENVARNEESPGQEFGTSAEQSESELQWFSPFLNATSFRLMKWFWNGSSTKSIADLQALAENVLKAADFRQEELSRFSAKSENRKLDSWTDNFDASSSPLVTRDGWIRRNVDIQLPTRCRYELEQDIPRFSIPGLHYRPLVEVIKAAFRGKSSLRYHYTPFRQYWTRGKNEAPERVYDELFSGDAWIRAHTEVQRLPRDPEDRYERAIAGLMFWSDSTHLTNFGNASVWPMYLYFGNQSKYERARPNLHACHHVAYFPKMPDHISEAFKAVNGGKLPTVETLTHCKRELMHSLLDVIFDANFLKACQEGILIECFDGETRRIFPRVMTYSADYPEKVLLSSIRYLSTYPCPRCLIKKSQAHRLGTPANENIVKRKGRDDTHSQRVSIEYARKFIYKEGRGVKSTAVEAVLASESLVPTMNAFSKFMCHLQQNFYKIFVVDLMHEIEIGLWKMLFTHLIRILIVCGQAAVLLLNERYRRISTFGRDTIRKFTNDASSLKRMAARDYEDLLLCSMPVFEGLFPENHDATVQNLLYHLLTWHALAKLRIHTDSTLVLLERAKRRLGASLARFQDTTCQAYETRELPSERAQRERREARKSANQANQDGAGLGSQQPGGTVPTLLSSMADRNSQDSGGQNQPGNLKPPIGKGTGKGKNKANRVQATGARTHAFTDTRESKRKKFNLNTYKAHAPDHYLGDIQEFGTTDSYSTQIGELAHRTVKKFYGRTNKYNAVQQMTRIERREYVLRQISAQEPNLKVLKSASKPGVKRVRSNTQSISTPFNRTEQHHFISNSRNDSIYLQSWLREHIYDSATRAFRYKLKNHLLERLLKISYDETDRCFTDADRNTIQIEYERLYKHKVLRVRYTSYDGQRKEDSLNPRNHADIMMLASRESEVTHPYVYARILGIFHTVVRHTGPQSTTEGMPLAMEFLWIRRFEEVTYSSNGPNASPTRLHAIKFVEDADPDAFGFLDPQEVIRGVHILPAFHYGKTSSLLPSSSIARHWAEDKEDWNYYYINSFVDRDAFMRFNGGGIGHSLLNIGMPLALNLDTGCSRTSESGGFQTQTQADSVEDVVIDLTGDTQHFIIDDENDEVRSVDNEWDEDDGQSDNISNDLGSDSDLEEEE